MADVFKKLLLRFSTIKVLHRLPGRLRLQVPGLNRVPPSYHHLREPLIAVIMRMPGVTNCSLDTVSGRALLTFDPQLVDERTVLGWIDTCWHRLGGRLIELQGAEPEYLVAMLWKELESLLEGLRDGADQHAQ